jgi:hypothetical protein
MQAMRQEFSIKVVSNFGLPLLKPLTKKFRTELDQELIGFKMKLLNRIQTS